MEWYSLALPVVLTFASIAGGSLLIFAYFINSKLTKSYAELQAKAEELDEDYRRRRKAKTASKARPSKQIRSTKVNKSKSSSKSSRRSQRPGRQRSPTQQSSKDARPPAISDTMQTMRAAIEVEGRVDIKAIVKMKNTMGFTTDDWRVLIHKVTPFLQEFTDHPEMFPCSRSILVASSPTDSTFSQDPWLSLQLPADAHARAALAPGGDLARLQGQHLPRHVFLAAPALLRILPY